jgi:hypothetical protein
MKVNKPVICADGFKMSVQAHDMGSYSTRDVDTGRISHVEVGFPNRYEPLLQPWVDNPERPLDTVYAYVPVERVALVCAKHGGVVSGELPDGVVRLEVVK